MQLVEMTALEKDPRKFFSAATYKFYSPSLARTGDTWHHPEQGYNELLKVKYVTKYRSKAHNITYYVIAFDVPENAPVKTIHIEEGCQMGTFYVGGK